MPTDSFTNMGLLLGSSDMPKAVNMSGEWARIAPFATYILYRPPQRNGVNFNTYRDPVRKATVLFINPEERKGDDYIPLINAFKTGSDLSTATITYQWPRGNDTSYINMSKAHFGSLHREATDFNPANGDKHNHSFCSVFVFVKVHRMMRGATSGKFLCLGRFEVIPNQNGLGTTTLKLFQPPVPLAARSLPRSADPTYDDADIYSVTSDLSGEGLRLNEVRQ
jgi:hypothetical protein